MALATDRSTRLNTILRPQPIPGVENWGVPPEPQTECDPDRLVSNLAVLISHALTLSPSGRRRSSTFYPSDARATAWTSTSNATRPSATQKSTPNLSSLSTWTKQAATFLPTNSIPPPSRRRLTLMGFWKHSKSWPKKRPNAQHAHKSHSPPLPMPRQSSPPPWQMRQRLLIK